MASRRSPAGESAAAQSEREQAALLRWHPGDRWYYPALAGLVVKLSTFVTEGMNSIVVENRDAFEVLRDRGNRGLLTFSNHVSMFDDPLLIANFIKGPYRQTRWVASDALNFFGSAWKAWLFTAGRCAPVVRGAGIEQPGLLYLRDRLRDGAWVHIFPEGTRTRDPGTLLRAPFKSGAGYLIAEANPIALPFYHYGMHEVLPIGAKMPRCGKTIRLVFGEQIDCGEAFVRRPALAGAEGPELWQAIADIAYGSLRELELKVNPHAKETPFGAS